MPNENPFAYQASAYGSALDHQQHLSRQQLHRLHQAGDVNGTLQDILAVLQRIEHLQASTLAALKALLERQP